MENTCMKGKVSVRSTYLSQSKHNHIDLESADIEKDIMLLDAGCGYGKTTLMLNWVNDEETVQIYDEINRKRVAAGLKPTTRNRTLFLTSRKATYEQMRDDVNSRLFNGKLDAFTLENLVRADLRGEMEFVAKLPQGVSIDDIPQITTNAALAQALKRGNFEELRYDMVVADEAHSIILDTAFAHENYYLLKWLENSDYTKIFMTATPNVWTQFMRENTPIGKRFNFSIINTKLPKKYQADKVRFYTNTSMKTVLDVYKAEGKFDDDNKCLAFSNSAKGAVMRMLNDNEGRTMALISEYNLTKVKLNAQQVENIKGWKLTDKDDIANRERTLDKFRKEEYVLLIDIMNINASRKEQLIKHGKIENGIHVVIATSAYREGISIKEKSLSYVFSEYGDEANLIQAMNRNRDNNLKEIVVIINGNFRTQHDRQKEDMEKFLAEFAECTTEKEKELAMELRYREQDTPIHDTTARAKIVIATEKDEAGQPTKFEVNEYLYAYYAYMDYHYAIVRELTLSSEEKEERAQAREEGAQITTSLEYAESGEKLPTWKEFYDAILSGYSREGVVRFEQTAELYKVLEESGRVKSNTKVLTTLKPLMEQFKDIVLDAEGKKELVDVLNEAGIGRTRGRKTSWTSARRILEENGYEIIDKRVMRDGKRQRCVVIK